MTGSNCRHPPCKGGALPTELIAPPFARPRCQTIAVRARKILKINDLRLNDDRILGDDHEKSQKQLDVVGSDQYQMSQ